MSGERSVLDRLLEDVHGKITLTLESPTGTWACDLEHDRVEFWGEGDTPEEALLAAIVDRQIGDYYYYGNMDDSTPILTRQQMTERLHAAYLEHFGYVPKHEYNGNYLTDFKPTGRP